MRRSILLNSFLALTLLAGLYLPVEAQQAGKRLTGGVSATGTKTNGLSRTDIRPTNNDPFSGTDDDGELAIDAPKYRPQVAKPTVSPPKRPLQGNVDEGQQAMMPAQPNYAPQDMGGDQDMMPQQPAFNPNDPDSSPDMQLAWDAWHRRVAGAIFERFNFFAKAAFRHSPPIMARLSYQVTRDGHIQNLTVTQKSTNILFNVLCFQAVKSLDGDMALLQFPQGSRRMFVPKSGVFTQNYHGQAGFKYQVGDQETVQGAGRR
jgi:hypothetical protein